MTSYQNALDIAADKISRGEINAAQANVMIVQMIGVKVVQGRLPVDVRKALNSAVKSGELGHIKKDGLLPEVYHHKNARGKAIEERRRIMRTSINAISSVCGN